MLGYISCIVPHAKTIAKNPNVLPSPSLIESIIPRSFGEVPIVIAAEPSDIAPTPTFARTPSLAPITTGVSLRIPIFDANSDFIPDKIYVVGTGVDNCSVEIFNIPSTSTSQFNVSKLNNPVAEAIE